MKLPRGDSDITYTFPIGGEEFARNSIWVARSLHYYCNQPDIVTGIRPSEWNEVDDALIREFQRLTELHEVERPIPDYPISVKLQTMVAGSEWSDGDVVIHLDSDVLILSDPVQVVNPGEKENWMQVKPVDFANEYWSSDASFDDWRQFFREGGHHFPGFVSQSTIDKSEIPPLYNAGVVIAPVGNFASDWVEMTKLVWKHVETRYADQIALGLLQSKYERRKLRELDSWNLPGRLRTPNDITILRYEDFHHLLRVPNGQIWKKLITLGLNPVKESGGVVRVPRQLSRSILFYLRLHNYR